MAVTRGSDYNFIDVTKGSNTARHYLKDKLVRDFVAKEYDATKQYYEKGEICEYNHTLYKAKELIGSLFTFGTPTQVGAFDPTKWDEITELKDAVVIRGKNWLTDDEKDALRESLDAVRIDYNAGDGYNTRLDIYGFVLTQTGSATLEEV